MNGFTRRLFTLVAIMGGGVLAAAPTALADPPDVTPTSTKPGDITAASAPAPSPATPTPTRTPIPVLTGRAPTAAAPTPPLSPTVDAGLDVGAIHAPVRTGLAIDLARPAATPAAGTPQEPSRPATPVPAPGTPSTRTPTSTAVPGPSAVGGDARPTMTGAPAAAPPNPPSATTYVIAAGDNLWGVAATHLASVTGRSTGSVPNSEVTAYWQQVCDLNRSGLRSGNVNLVFPGEQIQLPPVGA